MLSVTAAWRQPFREARTTHSSEINLADVSVGLSLRIGFSFSWMGNAPSKTYWRPCFREANLRRSQGTLIPRFARRKPSGAWIINCEVRRDCFTDFPSIRTVTFQVSFPTRFNLLQIT